MSPAAEREGGQGWESRGFSVSCSSTRTELKQVLVPQAWLPLGGMNQMLGMMTEGIMRDGNW